MSSLQKFHRRTQSLGSGTVQPYAFSALGSGDAAHGFWMGTAGDGSKLIMAPKSTEVGRSYGSYGTLRGITSRTDGISNTNTLYSFGSAAAPAAYYCKTLTFGGYNTWYQGAIGEILTIYPNRLLTPFATLDSLPANRWISSTENAASYCYAMQSTGVEYASAFKNGTYSATGGRAVRRSTI